MLMLFDTEQQNLAVLANIGWDGCYMLTSADPGTQSGEVAVVNAHSILSTFFT